MACTLAPPVEPDLSAHGDGQMQSMQSMTCHYKPSRTTSAAVRGAAMQMFAACGDSDILSAALQGCTDDVLALFQSVPSMGILCCGPRGGTWCLSLSLFRVL